MTGWAVLIPIRMEVSAMRSSEQVWTGKCPSVNKKKGTLSSRENRFRFKNLVWNLQEKPKTIDRSIPFKLDLK